MAVSVKAVPNILIHLKVKGDLVWNTSAHLVLTRRLKNRKNSSRSCTDASARSREERSYCFSKGFALGREAMASLPQGWATGTDENGRVYCECSLTFAAGSVADSS